MKACTMCGHKIFDARQLCYHTITVDENGILIKNYGVHKADTPYGPFECVNCKTTFEEIPEVKFCDKEDCKYFQKGETIDPPDSLQWCRGCTWNRKTGISGYDNYKVKE